MLVGLFMKLDAAGLASEFDFLIAAVVQDEDVAARRHGGEGGAFYAEKLERIDAIVFLAVFADELLGVGVAREER
jgi:hypothetical protein